MQERINEKTTSKEIRIPVPELIIFDMDGTLIINQEFYRSTFSQTLNKIVEEERGQDGLNTLAYYRENFEGKGEFALYALGISYKKWADKLIEAPLDLISPEPQLVQSVRRIEAKKAIFTGSPQELAFRMLTRLGFDPENDFDFVYGWKEPEVFPLKWTCSPFVFASIAQRAICSPMQTISVGDNWDSDLLPAKQIGMKTAQIGKIAGFPDYRFSTISDFVFALKGGE